MSTPEPGSPPATRSSRLAAIALMLGLAAAPLAAAGEPAGNADPTAVEQAFIAENDAAMVRMMADMAVKPTGDIDRDFALMMIPHHQGAIDMAQAFLRYGRNEQLRRLAQEIVVEQTQEIAAMRLAIGEPVQAPAAAPAAVGMPGPNPHHSSK